MTRAAGEPRPLIIAHRGASGYLPEHTLEAKALAYGLGADYLEQDVVATRDEQLIVLHDVVLEHVTDVAERYPERRRADGRWYARDFDLAELQQLNVRERRGADGAVVYPGRFPGDRGRFRIPTLAEEITLIQGMNRASGRAVGIYPEIKRPAWHREEGVDLSVILLELLQEFGYRRRSDPVWLQCFDAEEVVRLRRELGTDLRIVQLIGENDWAESATDYEELRTPEGLTSVATIADGIGPWTGQLYSLAAIDGDPVSSGLSSLARERGLAVHPYTFRADEIAPGFDSFDHMVRWFVEELGIDGLFTDFPDRARLAAGRTNGTII